MHDLYGALVAVALFLAALLGAWTKGRRDEATRHQRDQAQAAARAAQERAHADYLASGAADPAGELRRDWSRNQLRGVAPDPAQRPRDR